MLALQNLKPNVILVDDHLVFRQGLKDMITMENIASLSPLVLCYNTDYTYIPI